jgi:hypothetical protein
VGAAPARLAANPPPPGRAVEVFGYPGVPARPDGGWVPATVRGQVGGGRLQLDSSPEAALGVQAGFSADFHTTDSTQGSGEFVAEGSVAPPGDGGVGGEVCLAQDG